MMLNTLSDCVYSDRSTDVTCCCEFNILDLGTVLASSKYGDCKIMKIFLIKTAVHDMHNQVDRKSP
jgi:hypothetical protein